MDGRQVRQVGVESLSNDEDNVTLSDDVVSEDLTECVNATTNASFEPEPPVVHSFEQLGEFQHLNSRQFGFNIARLQEKKLAAKKLAYDTRYIAMHNTILLAQNVKLVKESMVRTATVSFDAACVIEEALLHEIANLRFTP